MSRLMQSASALTVAAALAATPLLATAQTAESETEQAVETTAQEVEQGVEQAGQEVEQAVEGAAQELEVQEAEAEGEAQEVEVEVVQPSDQPAQSGETAQTLDADTEVLVQGEGAAAEEVEGAIRLQDENSILTSDLMKASVFGATGEKVGDIDDVIVSLDGMVEGVVIGVGGFLGIGEKHVAVEMQQLSVQVDEDNEPQLIIDTTREALEAAPDFVTAEEQRREAEAQALQQAPAGTAPAGGGMMTSDPATGMAPAAPATEVAPAPAEGEAVKQD